MSYFSVAIFVKGCMKNLCFEIIRDGIKKRRRKMHEEGKKGKF